MGTKQVARGLVPRAIKARDCPRASKGVSTTFCQQKYWGISSYVREGSLAHSLKDGRQTQPRASLFKTDFSTIGRERRCCPSSSRRAYRGGRARPNVALAHKCRPRPAISWATLRHIRPTPLDRRGFGRRSELSPKTTFHQNSQTHSKTLFLPTLKELYMRDCPHNLAGYPHAILTTFHPTASQLKQERFTVPPEYAILGRRDRR